MVKDPWWLFAYWEIQPAIERKVRSQLAPEEIAGVQSILRVYDVTDTEFPKQPAAHWFDIPLSGLASSWYIHANAPNRSFVVDIGFLTTGGRFLLLARSNRVTTPRFGPSDVIDEEWMTSDDEYWKLFGATAGMRMGSSPIAMKQWLERQLFSGALSSPGLFSPVKASQERSFWLWVDTEVVLYGATDPKASVTIQGQPVTLKPDGTFGVRMTLPEGTQVIPVEATSPDRKEKRSVTATVTRKTDSQIMEPERQTEIRQRGVS